MPIAIAPAAAGTPPVAPLAMAPRPIQQGRSEQPITLVTSKEWVIPPRPKPGRKPATDTPPTKRKAQNRDAQRAFRERRAARVVELEDILKEVEDKNAEKEEEYKDTINRITAENKQLKGHIEVLNAEIANLRAIPDKVSPPTPPAESQLPYSVPIYAAVPLRKRPSSPPSVQQTKRNKYISSEPLEIDFTTRAKPQSRVLPPVQPPLPAPLFSAAPDPILIPDSCGFCSNGTPCICAEVAAQQQKVHIKQEQTLYSLPPIQEAVPFPPYKSASARSGGCPPGGCAQCKADPMSSLFCKTLAKSTGASSCCGGNDAGGGCCKGKREVREPDPVLAYAPPPPRMPMRSSSTTYLPCADVYQTLSRHKGFSESDLGAVTSLLAMGRKPGQGSMEFDTLVVREALKELDRTASMKDFY
ncbi:hypothetical protein YB2330_003539 [Saitoella coloradoensis]